MAIRPAVLTSAAVVRLKPDLKRREVPDGGMRGLSLLIHPSGAKSWIMRYRRPDDMTAMAKLTLGSADLSGAESESEPVIGGHLTLAAARRLAAEVNRQRALGHDPIADLRAKKQAQQEARNFGDAARNYVEEYARPKTRRWKETSRLLGLRPDDLGPIRDGLAHRWRDRAVNAITGHDLYAAIDETRRLGVPGLPRRRGISEGRARALASALSGLFGWLTKHRKIATNPCIGMYRPAASPARERVLSDDEVRWLWLACDAVGNPFGPLIKLLLITGARREEVAQMTRGELDGATWTIPGSRTKNRRSHTVPLPPLAQEIIAGMTVVAGERGYLFTTNGRTPVSGFSKVKLQIETAMLDAARKAATGAVIPPWRFHDLRRTAATGMARAGTDLHVIERALNHVSGSFGGIVGVYQKHRFEAQVADALKIWATMLLAIVEPSNVVPMRRA